MQENTDYTKIPVGDLVSEDYRRADIFKAHGIDFCCGGKKTIGEVSTEKKFNIKELVRDLNELELSAGRKALDFRKWELDFLCDYIVNTHHSYVKESIPKISAFLEKVVSRHGNNHPELPQIKHRFDTITKDLAEHMEKEEKVLFSVIKKMYQAKKENKKLERPHFKSLSIPISEMEADHSDAGKLLAEINELSSNYTPPAFACTTYKVTYLNLKQFEEDLHTHVHLENNVLFPALPNLEKEVFI
ncbi:MAG: iron-sulfur cluster repair di-iron protein [Calditrichaeota bacterium]|nr:MAG: iron-sulfur cluster repair di-iron protein [Calditrichota bacterium]MBL1207530.1 iron-sulfur cluster repair di-iron protein [Calditrichota bacterium]NOG47362.1 iron-sulfur cluster repair di-iron protein [Calditrichota bacterium]